MKATILIYGAGAIGRGYVPWVYSPRDYEFFFVEPNASLREKLTNRKRFTTYKIKNGRYEALCVPVAACFAPGAEDTVLSRADVIVTAVGPRNMPLLKERFASVRVPIICCENDSGLPAFMMSAAGNPQILFAIPDVITSNTAPKELLEEDELAIVTEDGVCFIDERARHLKGDCRYVDQEELEKQWLAKLYVHNTPHCIAAYLGAVRRVSYLHESLQSSEVETIVAGAMAEMEQMLVRKYALDQSFLTWYAEKELHRFRNVLLSDPISRVAREPFRKLALNDRLIGAAELCLSAGVLPKNVVLGMMAAFCYDNPNDFDFNIKYVMNGLEASDFLRIIIRLRPGEALYELVLQEWSENCNRLKNLSKQ